ncbi:MAG TPA: signal peptidase II [bacterium]|nr:signal peptidase II [bacterium]
MWAAALVLAWSVAQAADWVVATIVAPGTDRVVVPGLLSLTRRENSGVAFGLLAQLPVPVTVAVALTVLAVVLYNRNAWLVTSAGQWGLGLMIGGAFANITDRLRFGYVLDYLDVHVWPVFNLADTAIVVGAGLLVLALRGGAPRDGAGSQARGGGPADSRARPCNGGDG